jgi:hypothetical protein
VPRADSAAEGASRTALKEDCSGPALRFGISNVPLGQICQRHECRGCGTSADGAWQTMAYVGKRAVDSRTISSVASSTR